MKLHNAHKTCWNCPAIDLAGKVDFWASWCPPCKMAEPVIAELAEEYDGYLTVGKLNVDQNPKTVQRYHIMGVPTFAVFHAGEIVQCRTAARPRQQLLHLLSEVL